MKYQALEKQHLEFFKQRIVDQLKNKINDLLDHWHSEDRTINTYSNLLEHINFVHTKGTYSFLSKNIDKILIGKPETIKDVIFDFENTYPFHRIIETIKPQLNEVFSYTNFIRKDLWQWNAYTFCEKLDIRVCPYCNRNFTFTVVNENELITRPTLDHFYDKGKYPFLALSLYNLIPSCYTCNSTLKGKTHIDINSHLHPVISGFETEFKFRFIKEGELVDGIPKNGLEKYVKDNLFLEDHTDVSYPYSRQAEGNISLFKLNEIYKEHYPEVIQLYNTCRHYNKSILKGLYKSLDGLYNSKEELYVQLFQSHLDPKDFGKTVLSKLKRDIAEETGLLENLRKFFSEK